MRNGNSHALEEQINAEVKGYVSSSVQNIYSPPSQSYGRVTSNKSGGEPGVTFARGSGRERILGGRLLLSFRIHNYRAPTSFPHIRREYNASASLSPG